MPRNNALIPSVWYKLRTLCVISCLSLFQNCPTGALTALACTRVLITSNGVVNAAALVHYHVQDIYIIRVGYLGSIRDIHPMHYLLCLKKH